MKIINARVFIDGEFRNLEVSFDNEKITAIGTNLPDDEVIDARGQYLYPGLIDCHNHGGFLRSFQVDDSEEYGTFEEQVCYLAAKLPECGVTTVFPTMGGTDYERIRESLMRIRKLRGKIKGTRIGYFQLEGIYPSLKRYVTAESVNPSPQHTDYLVDNDYSDIIMAHVGPDLPGTDEWCEYMVSKGVFPTVGNTEASAYDVFRAADHGLCQADHMFNGYKAMHHREDGAALGVLLDDRIKAQVTCDGYHVSPMNVRLLIKNKGIDNVYGVSDMSRSSGMPEGTHTMTDGSVITVRDGFIFGENGYIVSGNMSLNEIMKAAEQRCKLSKEEVGRLYGENAAKCLNIKDRGKIEVGRLSDFTLMDEDYNVLCTIIGGKTVYQK